MNLSPLLFLSLSVLAVCDGGAFSTSQSDHVLARQLYDSVLVGDYDEAVAKTFELEKDGKGTVITDVVNRLNRKSNRNTLSYAYKLRTSTVCKSTPNNYDGKGIVKHYFPVQFKLILNQKHVTIINSRDTLALKLGWSTDDMNDRRAYGDSSDITSDRVQWKFIPFWDNNRVYFLIKNVKHGQFLKLGVETDGMGEHKAWGADAADTYRHQWYLQPGEYEDDIIFFIYNREYNHALKLGRYVDSDGDRILWGHNGYVADSPGLFGWYIAF